MKNTADTNDGTQIPTNFDGQDVNHWSFDGKITPEVIQNYLTYIVGLMQWLMTEGKKLLERDTPLSYEEWKPLSEKAFYLYWQMSTNRMVCLNFFAVFKKGISSLREFIKAHPEFAFDKYPEEGTPEHLEWYKMHQWVVQLQQGTEPNALFGIGSRHCRDHETRELFESTIALFQEMKSVRWLESLAVNRYPRDKDAQKWFVAAHKNW